MALRRWPPPSRASPGPPPPAPRVADGRAAREGCTQGAGLSRMLVSRMRSDLDRFGNCGMAACDAKSVKAATLALHQKLKFESMLMQTVSSR